MCCPRACMCVSDVMDPSRFCFFSLVAVTLSLTLDSVSLPRTIPHEQVRPKTQPCGFRNITLNLLPARFPLGLSIIALLIFATSKSCSDVCSSTTRDILVRTQHVRHLCFCPYEAFAVPLGSFYGLGFPSLLCRLIYPPS